MKKTSLKELAKHLGLSQTTVSRGLANYPEVTEATKTRIRKAAIQLSYAPSSSAQKLAMGRSFTIGHVITRTKHMTINPFYADFIAGASETYAAHGYDMLLSMTDPEDELTTYRNLTTAQKIDGFILSEPVPDDPRIALMQQLGVPFVVHGRAHETADEAGQYCWLDVNNRAGFAQGTAYLIAQGHHDIALLNGPENLYFALQRRKGFEQAMAQAGITPKPNWHGLFGMSEQAGYDIGKGLLQSSSPPSAILCSSFLAALGIQRAANELGIKIGQDLSVICWDDCLSGFYNSAANPQFTALQSSILQAGAAIAEMLINQITTPQQQIDTTLLEAELVIGKSTGTGPYFDGS